MKKTGLAWGLRLLAWVIILAPCAQVALSPRRAWLDGKYAQMSVAFEGEGAEKALIEYFGASAIYPDFEMEITRDTPPFLGDFEFTGIREYYMYGSPKNSDKGSTYFTVYLDEHDNALLPPFWGSLDYTFGFAGENGVPYFAGIEMESFNNWGSSRNGCVETSEWHVWYWEKNRWTSVLRVRFACDEYVRFEIAPTRDQAQEIICIGQKLDSYDEIVVAKFAWNPRDKTLTLASEPAFEFAMKKPMPPMTMDDPLPKFDPKEDEEEFEINEFVPPSTPE